MKIFNLSSLAASFLGLVTASCAHTGSNPTVLSVYYMGFERESPITITALTLPSTGSRHFEVTDMTKIREFLDVVDGPCTKAPPEFVNHDVRLLVKIGPQPGRQWEASQFFYRTSPTGSLCVFDAGRQSRVIKALDLSAPNNSLKSDAAKPRTLE
jgi:hypothetical protein